MVLSVYAADSISLGYIVYCLQFALKIDLYDRLIRAAELSAIGPREPGSYYIGETLSEQHKKRPKMVVFS